MLVKSILSKAIYKARKHLDKTQESVSEMLCLSPKEYRNIESGKSLPLFDTLLRLRMVLKIDINSICDEIIKAGYHIEDKI